jgi:D-alanyl-lipoteichoic acid acyltransferase DltB (MBOAT superfamily)
MSFFGIEFILFFVLVACSAYLLPGKYRCLFLLLAGYFFYFTRQPAYLALLFLSTVVDYFIALKIGSMNSKTGRQQDTRNEKRYLITGILLSAGLLLFFKYFNFLNDFSRSLFNNFKIAYPIPTLDIILPLGISYYIFKKISYLSDVYRGHLEPERNFIRLALYISFFPEIAAGPIDRAGSLLPQFLNKLKIDYARLTEGVQLIFWGLFKKLVIADRVGILVNAVYDHPDQHSGGLIGLATLFYSLQIYCDFSGYSDIAIGMGRVLGFKFMDNFKRPYLADSIAGFWERWHISLSTWLRDYLFLPISYSLMRRIDGCKLSVKRADKWAYVGSVLCTMLLCGLWHGANWTFVAWGLAHGIFLTASFLTRKIRKKTVRLFHLKKIPRLRKGFKVLFTFSIISFSWLLFRANSLADSFTLFQRFFSPAPLAPRGVTTAAGGSLIGGLSLPEFAVAITAIVFLMVSEFILEKKDIPAHHLLRGKPVWLRWTVYFLVIFSVLLFGIFRQQAFIYGRF